MTGRGEAQADGRKEAEAEIVGSYRPENTKENLGLGWSMMANGMKTGSQGIEACFLSEWRDAHGLKFLNFTSSTSFGAKCNVFCSSRLY